MPEKVQFIKKDAIIPIKIGSEFLRRMQMMSVFLVQDKPEAEIEELRNQMGMGTIPEGTWMYHFETLAVLIHTLEQTALDSMLTEEREVG